MKILIWILGIIGALALLLIGFLAYLGMFSKIEIAEKEMGPYTFVYESFVGDYYKTGPVFDRVYKQLKSDGIETTKGLGIYYDDPKAVASDKLRSDCGSVIETNDIEKIKKLNKDYKIKTIDAKKSVVVEFPIKNPLSYMLAPMKVYPVISKYIEEKKYKITLAYEIYDMQGKVTYYVMQIE